MSDHEFQEEDYKKRLDPGLWKRILAHARPYRRPLAGLAVAGVVVAAVDALLPRVTGLVIDEAIQNGPGRRLWMLSVEYLALVALMAGMVWFFIVMAGRAATGFAYDLRRAGFARLQDLSFSFYDRRPVGWLISRITSDCDRVSGIIPWFLLDLVWGTSLIAGISFMMLHLNVRLALLVMAVMPPLAVASVVFQRKLLRSQREMRKTNSRITASFNEEMMGVRTTKALVREEASLGEFRSLSGEMYRYSMRNAMQAAIYLPIVITLGSVGVGLSLWRGGVDISAGALGGAVAALAGGSGDPMTFGTLVAFIQYAAFFYIPVQELAERFTQLQAAQAAAERIQGLLDTVPEIRDGADAVDPGEETIGQIEFHNVSFQYKEGQAVLQEFNLRARAGETIALVGPTGGGKSTIVSLVSRFYEPTAGEIRINGVEYRKKSLQWLQSQLGVVLQTPHLFSGSVKENIRYGRLDATDEEVYEAARLVNADGFIQNLEGKYETDVGEGGNRLSTGQKQLVSLARAVLADPQIFIMDEATSSVDTETERLIQSAIETVLEGRISFVIAHRLSTIRSADRILVIEKGRIVEEGNHEELIRRRGHYYGLYTSQFAREGQDRILEEASKMA
jgi:ATP-binding cassette subfamily B protein